MRRLFSFLIVLFCVTAAWGVPAYPGLITAEQPDGTTISFYLHGDEHFSYATTEDGYLLMRNAEGVFEYARFDNDVRLMSTGIKANNQADRSTAERAFLLSRDKVTEFQHELRRQVDRMPAVTRPEQRFPLVGSPRVLIILVGYKDVSFSTPRQNFDDMANLSGYSANGATGSIHDYFDEASFGTFSPRFDVYGPYTLPNNRAYYGASSSQIHDVNASQMIVDACDAALADGVDFSQYDTDGDGVVDNIFVYYAGNNEAEGAPDYTIWPHKSAVSTQKRYSGKALGPYACTSEFRGTGRGMCGIGTFCHEFSHVLGLPDFYDVYYSDGISAFGKWDVMTGGNYNNSGRTPPTYLAYERFMLGWLTPRQLTDAVDVDCEGLYHLHSLISSNEAYIVSKTPHNLKGNQPSPGEFFMLEYRKLEGGDTYTEGVSQGMLISHVVYNPSTWSSNCPNAHANSLGFYPVTPGGVLPAACSDRDVYPGSTGTNFCTLSPRDNPTPFARQIVNISDYDTVCEFGYITPRENLRLSTHDIDAYSAPQMEQFVVSGNSIADDVTISFTNSAEFKMRRHSADNSGTYQTSIVLSPDADSLLNDTLDILYTPQRITYDEYQNNSLFAKAVNLKNLTKISDFRYRNRRPVYITTPLANEVRDLTANSAVGSWSFVPDTVAGVPDIERYGARYYVDVYNIDDNPTVETEDFEHFPDAMLDGWSANFTTLSTSYKIDQQAALFTQASDTIYTREYMSDADQIGYWLKSITSTGLLVIEGWNAEAGEWFVVKQQVVNNQTQGNFTVNLGAEYRRFRVSYRPDNGRLAFDNFSVTVSRTVNYLYKDAMVADTVMRFDGLRQGVEYRYVVRATDKDTLGRRNPTTGERTPRYWNITGNSNEVTFSAGEAQTDDGMLPLTVVETEAGNRYIVYIPEQQSYDHNGKHLDYALFIYTIDGRMVERIPVNGASSVLLPELPNGVYVVKYTADGHNVRKDRFAKFYYGLNH